MIARAMKGDRDACLEAGMNDYVAKLITATRLKEALLHWLAPEGGIGLTVFHPTPKTGRKKEETLC